MIGYLFYLFLITEKVSSVIMKAEKVGVENALGSLAAQLVTIIFSGSVPYYFSKVTLFHQLFFSCVAL